MAFRPSLAGTALLALVATMFVFLGGWQMQRAEQKAELQRQSEAAPRVRGLPAGGSAARFTRVTIEGVFDANKHVLIDNRVHESRAGVHVLTPFKTDAGPLILVNRGWLPMPPDRRRLPEIPEFSGQYTISGVLDELRGPGRQLGPADRMDTGDWPQLVTYPDSEDISIALGASLYPWVLLLDPGSPGGFSGRDWRPVVMTPAKHRAYAFQWFALATAALAAWIIISLRRPEARDSGAGP